VLELGLEEDCTFGVNVDHAISAVSDESEEDEAVVEGCVEVEYFSVGFRQLNLVGVAKDHDC
jgi:hypothetical protein